MSTETRDRTRRIRKKLRETAPACIAVVDHGEYVGAYFYPEDMAEGEQIVKAHDWEGVPVHVRPTPPLGK